MTLFRGASLLAALVLAPACAIVSYRYQGAEGRSSSRGETLYYRIKPFQGISMGGIDDLKRSMRQNGVFDHAELVDAPTAKGVSVEVEASWVPPSLAALVYGYVDLGLLFALPLYSDSMGYDVQYKVYVNGQKARIYEYPIRRTVFAWLPVLPFVWANAFTDSEGEAFAAVTRRFFVEASRDGAFDGRLSLPPAASARVEEHFVR